MAVAGSDSESQHPSCAIAVELTYGCNQACAYCYNPSREQVAMSLAVVKSPEPTAALLLRRLHRLRRSLNITTLTVTGGEPLRFAELLELLDGLAQLEIPLQLISNGTLVTEALAAQLSQYGLLAVQITLNGPTAELHREHVGRDSFAEAIRGAERLHARGVPVTGCIVVTRRNAEQVGRIIELWQAVGAQRIALSRFSPAGLSLERMTQWLPRREDLMLAFEQARPFAQAGLPIHCTVPVPSCLFDTAAYAPIQFGQCAIGSPYQEFALGPDGALRLCTLHAGRLAGGRDVLDEDWDLSSLMQLPEVTSYRAQLPQFCVGCAAAPMCLGGCGASSVFVAEQARALDPLLRQYFPDAHELPPAALSGLAAHSNGVVL